MTVIGIIGIIGTVEYSHAQTILEIEPPVNANDKKDRSSMGLGFGTKWPYWHIIEYTNETLISSTEETIDENEKPIGEIFVPGSRPPITTNPKLTNGTAGDTCGGTFTSLKNLLIDRDLRKHGIPNLKTPDGISEPAINKRTDNVTLYKANNITAIGFDWYKKNNKANTNCTINFELTNNNPIILTKELRYTLYNQSDNKAYYFAPRENITKAQTIPLCTTDNLNTTDQTLKGDTKMCYGKHGDNMVIITKKLNGFYGATEYTEQERQEIKEREQREKEYTELLKRLYLPAI